MLYNYVFWNQGLPVSNRETKCNLNYQTEFSKFVLIPSVFEQYKCSNQPSVVYKSIILLYISEKFRLYNLIYMYAELRKNWALDRF